MYEKGIQTRNHLYEFQKNAFMNMVMKTPKLKTS